MTPQEMRIAIAGKCGFIVAIDKNFNGLKCPVKHCDTVNGALWVEAPNYPEDLNECHEMEAILSNDQANEYETILENMNDGYSFCASALQRCEAFCRVFWPERF